jgi:hypothetical protein
MKIIGCRINFGSKRELFELLPATIVRIIESNTDQNFDFKIQVNVNGRNTSVIKSFGPDFIGQTDFEVLRGQTLPILGNRSTIHKFAKFNDNGTIDILDQIQNEGALPRESTVKQLQKIRQATKSTTIDDRIPKLKGANLSHERNVVDSGIESYEDFQKKNKSFIPGWNLKHLTSPYRK